MKGCWHSQYEEQYDVIPGYSWPLPPYHVEIALIIFEMMEIATLSKATHSLTDNEARYVKMKKAAGPWEGEPTPAVAASP